MWWHPLLSIVPLHWTGEATRLHQLLLSMSYNLSVESVDIEKIALAIEADAGMALDDIRQGLAEMQIGLGRITTPEQILIHTALQSSEGLSPQHPTPNIDTPLSLISTF
jgi:hypothetical protein